MENPTHHAGLYAGNTASFAPDASQKDVIEASGGYHLVLAPPGCGKTQILTERIRRAHEQGVDYKDMVCLTFTNRAARGMRERIAQNISDKGVEEVFVGNLHRFCSRYLFDHAVVAAETSIIDEDESAQIIARFCGDDETLVSDNRHRRQYAAISFLAHMMKQIESRHPKELRMHPEALDKNDMEAVKTICHVQQMELSPDAMVDIYQHTDIYLEAANGTGYDFGERSGVVSLLRKMQTAWQYEQYKHTNKLIDFEDLLIMAYDALADDPLARYSWIQVDEVQDLNPLQLAIVDRITASEDFTVMYLGDGQQAIFSFMGAKMSTLTQLSNRCKGNIHHLAKNHRSPRYLLRVFNTYAEEVLGISHELLPEAVSDTDTKGDELQLMMSKNVETEIVDVARKVKSLIEENPGETTAVIVTSNNDAELISGALLQQDVPHFKISGTDLFATPEMKLVLAHLSLLNNEHNFIAWARMLRGLHIFETATASRNFVQALHRVGMLPSDLLDYNGESSYIRDFVETYEQRDIIIFDTETTGLNVFDDDILQIAAVRLHKGEMVEGSEFSVYMQSDRPIPEMLGDIRNPIIEEMKHQPLLSHAEGLRRFLDYAKGGVLLGHNADYDYHILDNNLQHYLPSVSLGELHPRYFDSLKLIRILGQGLRQYKLKYLLEALHLEGENAHLADADVNATRSLVDYCYEHARLLLPQQKAFMERPRVKDRAQAFIREYQQLYQEGKAQLFAIQNSSLLTSNSSLLTEMSRFYHAMQERHFITEIPHIEYVYRYIASEMLSPDDGASLWEQLGKHVLEMSTLKEADLCNSRSIDEKVYVTTVHKAKGLEFDNVIVFDAVEGRYPNFYNDNNPRGAAEDARKFYVAITRSKRRLIVAACRTRINYHNQILPRELTRFMRPIVGFFSKTK